MKPAKHLDPFAAPHFFFLFIFLLLFFSFQHPSTLSPPFFPFQSIRSSKLPRSPSPPPIAFWELTRLCKELFVQRLTPSLARVFCACWVGTENYDVCVCVCAFLCVPACVWGILAACVTASRVERRQNGVARWDLIWTLWLGKALWSWSDYVTLITEASSSSSCPAIRERWYKGRDNTCLLNHIYDVSLSWCAKKPPTTTKKKDNHGCNTYVTCHFPNFQRLCWRSKICFYSPTRPEHPQQSESVSKRQLESCKLNFGNGDLRQKNSLRICWIWKLETRQLVS